MLSSDLVFNVLAAAAAFGAVIVLAPSAARIEADPAARYYADAGGVRTEARLRTALSPESNQVKPMRRVVSSQTEAPHPVIDMSDSEPIGRTLDRRADHE